MPVSLDGLEVTFKQLHHECIKHAKRREALLSQVSPRSGLLFARS